MRLYDLQSSAGALTAAKRFSKVVLAGNFLAEVFVRGRNGLTCSKFSGNGVAGVAWCTTSLHFYCEFYNAGEYKKNYITLISESFCNLHEHFSHLKESPRF